MVAVTLLYTSFGACGYAVSYSNYPSACIFLTLSVIPEDHQNNYHSVTQCTSYRHFLFIKQITDCICRLSVCPTVI